jgi:pyruvate dehydrogenase phosphatase
MRPHSNYALLGPPTSRGLRIFKVSSRHSSTRSPRNEASPLGLARKSVALWASAVVAVPTLSWYIVSLLSSESASDPNAVDPNAIDSNATLEIRYLQCMKRLRKEEKDGRFSAIKSSASAPVQESNAIRFHSTRVPSNYPVEDEMVISSAPGLNRNPWLYWGVFDGHAGFATSMLLAKSLVPHVSRSLSELSAEQAETAVIPTIKQSFLDIDNRILQQALLLLDSDPPTDRGSVEKRHSLQKAMHSGAQLTDSEKLQTTLAPAFAGSCALLAMFDCEQSKLRVACTGDSRAVLGRSSGGKYHAIPLSIDQNGFNAAEVERLTAQHPNEEGFINFESGRVLGFALSRAFGNARCKWNKKDSEKAKERFGGPRVNVLVKTPPYMTAEPEITETVVNTTEDNADFLIMASDGLWDYMSSGDAVECVHQWAKAVGTSKNQPARARKMGVVRNDPTDLAQPISSNDYQGWTVKPADFVCEEPNAATHLVQNAFGGKRRALLASVVAADPPLSRYARDDVTVHVVFFGKVGGHEISRWTEKEG